MHSCETWNVGVASRKPSGMLFSNVFTDWERLSQTWTCVFSVAKHILSFLGWVRWMAIPKEPFFFPMPLLISIPLCS